MLLDLGAKHNAEKKGEDEAVSENPNNVVVELEDKIDKQAQLGVPHSEIQVELN